MRASPPRFRRRLAFASALAGVVALVGCQVILGIDPDSRYDAVAGGDDATFHDVVASDASRLDAEASAGEGSVVLDAGSMCHTNAECAPLVHAACEQAICGDAGACEVSSRDGKGCGGDGTCRGYACIGSGSTIATSNDSTCITTLDGFVWCWGADPSGILGDQGSAARSTPYLVSHVGQEMPGAREVSLGNAHACAILNDPYSTIACWGSNQYGQSTASDAGAPLVGPSQIYSLPPADELAAGFGQTCIASDGNVWCWGDNEEGEIGGGPGLPSVVRSPVHVLVGRSSGLSGAWKTVCVSSLGGIWCWGDSTWGQLGKDVADASTSTPTQIAGLTNGLDHSAQPTFVSTSWGNICVGLSPSGFVECLGNDRYGQLGGGAVLEDAGVGGSGDIPGTKPSTVVVYSQPDDDYEVLGGIRAVYGGTGTHFCAQLRNTSEIYCWGHDEAGEIGGDPAGSYSGHARLTLQVGTPALFALGNAHACELVHDFDGWTIWCLGDGSKGQLGDGLPIAPHSMNQPRSVTFPTTPGGLDALRASQ